MSLTVRMTVTFSLGLWLMGLSACNFVNPFGLKTGLNKRAFSSQRAFLTTDQVAGADGASSANPNSGLTTAIPDPVGVGNTSVPSPSASAGPDPVEPVSPPAPFIDFFTTAERRAMVGLSCSSESECRSRCGNGRECQKPIETCLNCVGSKSPYLGDLFNNVGGLTTTCFDQGLAAQDAQVLFENVAMVPITASSAYNPLSLTDMNMTLKFMTLCPFGTRDPVVVAFTDPTTHGIQDIPLVKCGKTLFPLVRLTDDCAQKAVQIQKYIRSATQTHAAEEADYRAVNAVGDLAFFFYDILQVSDFAEAQYLRCDGKSQAACQKVCRSSRSCTLPLSSTKIADAIVQFHKLKWQECPKERFSSEILMRYLTAGDAISFSYKSLSQVYDLPLDSGGFFDLSILNYILSDYKGIFVSQSADGPGGDSSFFVSSAYRDKLRLKMKSLCDGQTDPIILGKAGKIERVLCRSDRNGYFRTLVSEGESCEAKSQTIRTEGRGIQ